MLKIIAGLAATLAVLAGLAIAADEETTTFAGVFTETPTETPAETATATAAPTATAATASPTAAPTGTAAGTATPTARAATPAVTPAAVPGTGGEPNNGASLLLLLAIGAGVVAGTAGLAGAITVTRRS